MLKHLLVKEFRLALHPTALLFLGLSALMLIPNYPYYVTFFYTTLGLFFCCLTGRENHDIFYTMSLPVRKSDIVRARLAMAVSIELAQIATAIPCALLRRSFDMPGNQAGIEANAAFFGLALLMLGLFNTVFFCAYYRDPDKVGRSFLRSSIVSFLFLIVAEGCVLAIPALAQRIDNFEPQYLGLRLAVLAAGALLYLLLTWLACQKSIKSFTALDL